MKPEWVKDLPPSWDSVPFGSIFIQSKRKNSRLERDFVLSVLKDRGVLPYSEKGSIGNKVSDDLSGYKLVDRGDFVLNSMNLYMGSVGVSKYDGVTSTAYIVCKPRRGVCADFYRYLIQFRGFQEFVGFLGKGIMEIREAVRWTALKSVFVPLPDPATQHEIADFLDRETARIDLLIEKKQRLVRLLNEKIVAIYDSAVLGRTGEYDAFQEVDVPWIRNIPSHWEIKALKRLLDIPITDGPHETPEFIDDGILFISAESIQRGEIDFSRARGFISPKANEKYRTKYFPKSGDIYIVKSGATTGKSAMVGAFVDFNIWSPLAVLRTSRLNDKNYLLALVRSTPIQDAIKLSWSWGTQQNIGMSTLGRILAPVPPLREQRDLIDWIEARVNRVEPAIVGIKASIERLQEYRSALIAAAVTGQIDARAYKESGSTDRRLEQIQQGMGA